MEISLNNMPLDPVVIILVLLAGLFQKKYLETINLSGAWKTLLVSTIFTIAYALLIALAGKYTKDLPLKCFFSFVTATSLYELLLKKFLGKYFSTGSLGPDNASKIVIVFLISLSMISPARAMQPATHRASLYTLTKAQSAGSCGQDSLDLKHLQDAQTAYMQVAMPFTGLLLGVLCCAILIVALGIIWMKEKNENLLNSKLK